MPHISAHSVSEKTKKDLDLYILAFLEQTGSRVRKNVFHELLTKTERIMLSKRLAILLFIIRGIPTHMIAKTLKMSPSTIARFETLVDRGAFTHTRKWLSQKRVEDKILNALVDLVSIPFKAQRKSLSQLLDEMA
ncbi:MAG: hypothetical protein AAB805_01170 [Patescibacteria group bacterium]